ncbi:MAG: hypothetical protein A2342_07595 [Gallionellales bacterium RIFOXYB12_FULL_54_9]|nr:MAG: hypothetical protein A2342_07595 [Gallionellales bacterium RIFOXYB12_FULL_54_9]
MLRLVAQMKSRSLFNVIKPETASSADEVQRVGSSRQECAPEALCSSNNAAAVQGSAEFNVKFLLWNTVSRVLPDLSGQKMVGSCNGCGNCCRASKCQFLAERDGRGFCTIYHHPLRKLLNCDSYPANQRAVAMVDCPGFKFVKKSNKCL